MTARKPPEKLSIVVFSGDFAKAHYALAMASAAAAIDRSVTLFYTMDALHALADDKQGAGWRDMPAGSREHEGGNGGTVDDGFKALGVADYEQLLSACADLGVTFMVCEMGLRAIGMEAGDLRDDIDFVAGGLVTFLNDASADGVMIFI